MSETQTEGWRETEKEHSESLFEMTPLMAFYVHVAQAHRNRMITAEIQVSQKNCIYNCYKEY